ncbi:MAG: ABC transporter substrate-binding protein [Clostridiales bacterium]|jgi:putative ABC transport system substrate-binding protein|nr:ABC transporter substrate-binding protein [Clostridiales bacterium]
MKKLLAVLLALVLIIAIAGCEGKSKTTEIGIIQFVEHAALDASREGFIAALKDNGFVDGENIKIDYQNAQGDSNNLSTISDRFVGSKVDMVLAIATPAAQSIASKTTTIPILATAVTDFESAKLVNSDENPGGNVSGTSDMNPIEEQIDLLQQIVPDAKRVGLIYSSSEDNSVLQAGIAKEIIESRGLEYHEVTVTNSNDVQQAAESLMGKCDAVYAPTDNVISSAFPAVYSASVNAKIPVICGEENQVTNGGLATLGINYYNLGYQTGLMAVDILKNKADISKMAVQKPDNFDFAINGRVAEEIGIEIPEELQQYIIAE